MTTRTPTLVPRPVVDSVAELLEGCRARRPFAPADARSGARFERVEIDGSPYVVKHVHVDDDFTMRVSGDIGCRPLRAWATGLMDVAADVIDHATIGVARNDGRNGWGAALLMRDVSGELVPVGDGPIPEQQHTAFLDHLAAMAARMWGWRDDFGLLPHRYRWWFLSGVGRDGERALGWPEDVPRIADEGWQRFAVRAPARIAALIAELDRDPTVLSDAIGDTPSTFLHGDWKFGNLGTASDGRTVLLDWAYPGEGPVAHELAWYLALNRSRLPVGHTKERVIADFRTALEAHGVRTDPWWPRQLGLCLLGAVLQFGWEKALGPDDELGWWCDRALEGERWL